MKPIEYHLRNQLWNQIGDQMWNQLRNRLWNQFWGQQIGGQLRNRLWDQLGYRILVEFRNQTNSEEIWE